MRKYDRVAMNSDEKLLIDIIALLKGCGDSSDVEGERLGTAR